MMGRREELNVWSIWIRGVLVNLQDVLIKALSETVE
jgi:hypothetical protein